MTIINTTSVTIDTTVPTLTIGQIQLSADRRSTTANKLTDAERIRRAVLPAGHWGELAASINDARSQSLTDILRTALTSIASDRLRDTLAAEPMQRTISLQDYTVPALLAWNSETAAGRGSITFTREQVEAWLASSATLQALQTKWQATGKTVSQLAALQQFVTNRFATLAAKNHGLKDEADASKLAALIDPADLDGSSAALVTEILGRLDAIGKQLKAKAAEATISMDDL
jgi:predicted transcriptional regulator